MTGNLPFSPPFDHLVYLRVFEGCDLRCQHCFIPANPRRLRDEDIAAVPEKVRSFARPGDRVMLQWHGGEPTMFGPEWMDNAIATIEAAGPEFVWVHGIQTNLMSYSPDWAEVYRRRFGGEVGVSWDADIRLTRRDDLSSFADFEARFWPNLDRLVADGLEPYLVVTATRIFFERFRNPFLFFEMLERHNIRRGHLERVTETGEARRSWDRVGLTNAEYGRQMSRFARAYVQWNRTTSEQGRPHLALSPFDGILKSAADLADGRGRGYGCWSGACDTRFHTIDADGYKRGCTALTAEIGNRSATKELPLDFSDLQGERGKRRIVNCAPCEFRSICSTGCLAVSMDDGSGECSGGYSLFKTAKELASTDCVGASP